MAEEKEEQTNEKKGILDVKLIIVAVAIIIIAAAIAFVVAKTVVNPLGQADNQEMVSRNLGPTYELDEIIVNLADTSGRRFLKTKITFLADRNRVVKELDDKRPLVRDRVIFILGDKTIADIESADGKELLKIEIMNAINPLLASGEVVDVFFETFTFQ